MARPDTRRALGAHGERIAAAHLERAGYEIVARNARCGRVGELDLVARGRGCLVFCEVKTRLRGTTAGPATPLEAVGPAKRRRMRRLAAEWLRTGVPPGERVRAIRFDAVGVLVDRRGRLLALDHVEDAF